MMLRDSMNQETYESPKFEFEEMQLTEKVAATCWGYAYAWYDADSDGVIDENGEKVDLSSLGLGTTGCQGRAAREALKNYFFNTFGVTLQDKDVSTNTDSQLIMGSNS